MRREAIEGVRLGTVVSAPDELGRVEVRYRGMPAHPPTRVPIATPLAGGSRGMYFMPEIDDEVLVAFLLGDFAQPFIVGFLWDGVEKPPETDRQNRIILTPGGHTLRFEDGAGKVVVKSAGGHSVVLDDMNETVTVAAAGGGNEIVIESDGKTTIHASSNVTVSAPTIDLTAEASQSVVFGELLQQYLNTLVAAYNPHTHNVFGLFPVTPPLPAFEQLPAPSALLSTRVKTG